MAIPVIVQTTSVLGYPQWQAWTYQPYATGLSANTANITWATSALPPGMTLNTATGAISGAVTQAGVYNVALWVTDSTSGYGTAAAVLLTIGVEARAFSSHSGVDLFIDVATGKVTTTPPDSTAAATTTDWLFALKENTDKLLYIHFVKDGTILDLGAISELKVGLKEFEPDRAIILSTQFVKTGSGTAAVYVAYVKLESAAFKAALSNYESDTGTSFVALAEIEWMEPNPITTFTGEPEVPSVLQSRTQTFNVFAERNLVAA